jgi:3-hydroxyacyl-CoA dehydrogenase
MNSKLAAAKSEVSPIQVIRRDGVMLLVLAHRPVNALSSDLRDGLMAGLKLAMDDPDMRAVVIASDIAQFSAGADMAELGRKDAGSGLAQLCNAIEASPKPVVVAINGNALGGGLELALAAHGRVTDVKAHLGLPEVSLGILPGSGGTQRLPRIVGAAAALKVLLETTPLSAAQALAIGLVDQVVDTGLRDAACAMALALAAAGAPVRSSDRRDGLRDGVAYQAAIAAARKQFAGARLPAPGRVIDCIEAAQLLPLDQGLAYERAAFDELVQTPEAMGLRHAFMAERRALFPPADLAALAPAKLSHLGVWGGGDVATELVVQALVAGLRVTLVEPRREVLVPTLEKVAARQELAVVERRLTAAARDADWARLTSTMAADGMVGVDLVLTAPEAVPMPADADGAPVIGLGALPARAMSGRVALQPAMAAGMAAELSCSAGADAGGRALGLALARRLGWKLLFTGPGGPLDRRLRAALSAAIAGLEAQGLTRPIIAAALASYGLGVGERAAMPPAPPEAQLVLSACLLAMANQGARLLSDGVARRPLDIDAAAIMGGLFPRWQGGPMFQADKRGLLVLRADLRRRAEAAPQIYAPDALFDRLISEGRDFAALNRA